MLQKLSICSEMFQKICPCSEMLHFCNISEQSSQMLHDFGRFFFVIFRNVGSRLAVRQVFETSFVVFLWCLRDHLTKMSRLLIVLSFVAFFTLWRLAGSNPGQKKNVDKRSVLIWAEPANVQKADFCLYNFITLFYAQFFKSWTGWQITPSKRD